MKPEELSARIARDPLAYGIIGEEIAAFVSRVLPLISLPRRVFQVAHLAEGEAHQVRKAGNVSAFFVGEGGATYEGVSEGRSVLPAESDVASHPALYPGEQYAGLDPSTIEETTARLSEETKVELLHAEEMRMEGLLSFAAEQVDHLVRARYHIGVKELREAISLVEKTGSPATHILMNRASVRELVCDSEAMKSIIPERDRLTVKSGVVGTFEGATIVTSCESVTASNEAVKPFTAYVLTEPAVLGVMGIRNGGAYDSEVFETPGAKGCKGWTVSVYQSLTVRNPYGIAKIEPRAAGKSRSI